MVRFARRGTRAQMKRPSFLSIVVALLIEPLRGQTPNPVEVEAQKCEERIGAVWLDEALAVRESIEKLQNGYVPVIRADAGKVVAAETLLNAYAADRGRADKIYKGQRITVRGVVGGFRPDPANAKLYLVYLTGGSG